MATIYRKDGGSNRTVWERHDAELIVERPEHDGHKATGYLIVPGERGGYFVCYAFRRSTGWEHASWCDPMPSFETHEEAERHARNMAT